MYLNDPRVTASKMDASAWMPSNVCTRSNTSDGSRAATADRQQHIEQQRGTNSQRGSFLNGLGNSKQEGNANLDESTPAWLPGKEGVRFAQKATLGKQELRQQQKEGSSSALNPIRGKGTGSSSFMPGRGKRYRTKAKRVSGSNSRSNGKPGVRGGGGGGGGGDVGARRRSTSAPTHTNRVSGGGGFPSPPKSTTKTAAAQPAKVKERGESRYGTARIAREKPRKAVSWRSIFWCWGGCGGVVNFSAGVGPAGGRDGEMANTTEPLTTGTTERESGRREEPLAPHGPLVSREGDGHHQQAADVGRMHGRTTLATGDRTQRVSSLEVSPSTGRTNTRLGSSSTPTVDGSTSSTSSAEEDGKHGAGESPHESCDAAGVGGDRRAASPTAHLSDFEEAARQAIRLSKALRGFENRRGRDDGDRRRSGDGGCVRVPDDDDDRDDLEVARFPPPRFASFPGFSPAPSLASTATLAAAVAAASPWSSPSSSFAGAWSPPAVARPGAGKERGDDEGRRYTVDDLETPEAASVAALWHSADGMFYVGSPDSAAASTCDTFRTSPALRKPVAAASPTARLFSKESKLAEEGDARRTGRRVRGEQKYRSTPVAVVTAVAESKVVAVRRPVSSGNLMRRNVDPQGAEDRTITTLAPGRRTRALSARDGGGGEGVHDQQPQQRVRPVAAGIRPRPARKSALVPTHAPHADSSLPRSTDAEAAAAAACSAFFHEDSGALEQAREVLSSFNQHDGAGGEERFSPLERPSVEARPACATTTARSSSEETGA